MENSDIMLFLISSSYESADAFTSTYVQNKLPCLDWQLMGESETYGMGKRLVINELGNPLGRVLFAMGIKPGSNVDNDNILPPYLMRFAYQVGREDTEESHNMFLR